MSYISEDVAVLSNDPMNNLEGETLQVSSHAIDRTWCAWELQGIMRCV